LTPILSPNPYRSLIAADRSNSTKISNEAPEQGYTGLRRSVPIPADWESCEGASAQLAAFTGAEGFGAQATGGRGGSVYVVSNLNDSGAGSLRDAVSQSNRIIVFAVSGYEDITSPISVKSNLTILGQTAPGGGFGVYGAEVSFYGQSNDIVRYMRFRDTSQDPGGTSTDNSSGNCVNLGNTNNMIFDHNYQAGFTTGDSSGAFSFDIINNYSVAGPSTSSASDAYYQVDSTQAAYAKGNLLDSNKNGSQLCQRPRRHQRHDSISLGCRHDDLCPHRPDLVRHRYHDPGHRRRRRANDHVRRLGHLRPEYLGGQFSASLFRLGGAGLHAGNGKPEMIQPGEGRDSTSA
jgi:hypothetical protein